MYLNSERNSLQILGVHIFLYSFWLVTINRFVNDTMISQQVDERVMNRE